MNRKLTIKEIHSEKNDELIWISNSRTNFWHSETMELARTELVKRNISPIDQKRMWNAMDISIENEREYEKIYIDLKKNYEEVGYFDKIQFSNLEKIRIFLFAPYDIVRFTGVGPSLLSLYKDKKIQMFWEKLILSIIGILFWSGIVYYNIEQSEKRRIEEIEKIDISDWEKKHGYDK